MDEDMSKEQGEFGHAQLGSTMGGVSSEKTGHELGPGSEHCQHFQAGRVVNPDVLMQVVSPDAQDPGDMDPRLKEELLRSKESVYMDPNLKGLLNSLRMYDSGRAVVQDVEAYTDKAGNERTRIVNREVEVSEQEALKGVEKSYESLMRAQLGEVSPLSDSHYFEFRSTFPYDSRRQEGWFETAEKTIIEARDGEWSKPEVRLFLESVREDISWGRANFDIVDGLSVVFPQHFDATLQTEHVKSAGKNPTARRFELAYARKPPGFLRGMDIRELSNEDKDEMLRGAGIDPDSMNGDDKAEIFVRLRLFKEALPESFIDRGVSLREKAIRYQDDAVYWKMAVAAVGQTEFDSNGDWHTFMQRADGSETITESERMLIQKVFGNADESTWVSPQKTNSDHADPKIKVPREIENFYSSSASEGVKRRYIARMSVIAEKGVKGWLWAADTLGQIPDNKDWEDKLGGLAGQDRRDKIVELWIDYVNREAEKRLQAVHSGNGNVDRGLSELVVKSGIVQDWGLLSSTEMLWGWSYDEDGKRSVEVGNAHAATDMSALNTWAWKDASNTASGNTRSGILPVMSEDQANARTREQKPGWKPGSLEEEGKIDDEGKITETVPEAIKNDPVLVRSWNALWQGWNDSKLKEQMLRNLWFLETPFTDPQIKGPNKRIQVPIFIPPEMEMSFYRNTSLGGKASKGDPTIWEELSAGKKMSELEWDEMDRLPVTRWLVNIQSYGRWLQNMTMAFGKEPYYKGLFQKPSQVEEFNKRTGLALRDKPDSRAVMLSLLPALIVMEETEEHDLYSFKGQDKGRVGRWAADLHRWFAHLGRLPSESGEVSGYSDKMVKMGRFYLGVMGRLATTAGKERHETLKSTEYELDKYLKEVAGVPVEHRDPAKIPDH